jgi:RNA recognition motif-containing protein
MNTKIYVGNLAATTTESELMNLFSPYGNVANIHVAMEDSNPGLLRSGCVTMVTSEGARSAIDALNGKTIGADTLAVSEVPPHKEIARSPERNRSPRRQASYLF